MNNESMRSVAPTLSNEAYTEHEIEDALVSVGFNNIERFPSLSGLTVDEAQELPAYVARS
jgi:hypothetical protein